MYKKRKSLLVTNINHNFGGSVAEVTAFRIKDCNNCKLVKNLQMNKNSNIKRNKIYKSFSKKMKMTKKNIVNLLVHSKITENSHFWAYLWKTVKEQKWGANYKIGETCSKGQLPMILHRIIKNLRWFFDKYLVQLSLLHTMGQERETHCSGGFTQTVWGPYFNI